MKNNIIRFKSGEERKKEITERVLLEISEDRREAYGSNILFRILLKFDYMSAEDQKKLFDYVMAQARKCGCLKKRNFIMELLGMIGGQETWEEVEEIADGYLIKEVYKHGKI